MHHMNNRNVKVEAVIEDLAKNADVKSRRFSPGKCLGDSEDAIVEVVSKDKFMMLHFEWSDHLFLSVDTEAQVRALVDGGYEVTAASGPQSGEKKYVYVKVQKRSHLWFCNFRRYGWAWSPFSNGETGSGFGYGPVYANGHQLAGLCETPEDVVKNTGIAAWGQFCTNWLPDFFLTMEVQVLFAELMADALKNVTQHAKPGHVAQPFKSNLLITRRESDNM